MHWHCLGQCHVLRSKEHAPRHNLLHCAFIVVWSWPDTVATNSVSASSASLQCPPPMVRVLACGRGHGTAV